MNKNVPGAKYLSATTWPTQEHYNFCCNRAKFVPGSNRSKTDLIFFAPVLQGHFNCSTQQFIYF